MSQIANIILGILSFEDPIISAIFYGFFLLVPWLTHFLGENSGQNFLKRADVVQKIFVLLFGLAGVVIIVMIVTGTKVDEATGEEIHNTSAIMNAIGISVLGIMGCFGLALGFGIMNLILNFKQHGKTLISIALFAIVMVVAYMTASSDVPQTLAEQYNATSQDYLDAGAGLTAFGILSGGAVLAILFGELVKLFR